MRARGVLTAISLLAGSIALCGQVSAGDSPAVDLSRCGQLANADDFTEGLRVCDQVISESGLDGVLLSTAYFYRGLIYRDAGDVSAAIEDFDTALLLAQVSLYYFERGLAYQVRGDLDAAIEDFDMALWMRPDDSRALNQRGETYRLKGDLLAARLDFDSAHMRDPDLFPLDGDARLARKAAWDR